MLLRTILVGTDLTPQSDPAILRGHELASRHQARLVVCHAGPPQIGVHPLFPQSYERDVINAAELEARLAQAVSERTAEVTGRSPDQFEVTVDQGDAVGVLLEQSKGLDADLIIVMGDRALPDRSVARDLARASSCSILAVGASAKQGVAVVAMEDEVDLLPMLVSATFAVVDPMPKKIDVILFLDNPSLSTARLGDLLAELGRRLNVGLVPWYGEIGDESLLRRLVDDSALGLVATAAPAPTALTADAASPFDDALGGITSSVLLLRT